MAEKVPEISVRNPANYLLKIDGNCNNQMKQILLESDFLAYCYFYKKGLLDFWGLLLDSIELFWLLWVSWFPKDPWVP